MSELRRLTRKVSRREWFSDWVSDSWRLFEDSSMQGMVSGAVFFLGVCALTSVVGQLVSGFDGAVIGIFVAVAVALMLSVPKTRDSFQIKFYPRWVTGMAIVANVFGVGFSATVVYLVFLLSPRL